MLTVTSLSVATRWMLLALAGAGALAEPTLAGPAVCGDSETFSRTRELHFVATARVRPMLFWIGRDNVGDARITWSRAAGTSQRLELLVGSDPRRTRMRVNRWGYLAETVCEQGADLVGVMTESGEESVEDASAAVSRKSSGGQAFRSIRAHVAVGRANADVARLLLPSLLTYRDLDALLVRIGDEVGVRREIAMPPGAAPGFLVAVTRLAERGLDAVAAQAFTRDRLVYVYNGQLFDLELVSASASTQGVDTEFRATNRATRTTSRFGITFDTQPRPAVPVRIRYRPRWWFEAELVLAEGSPRSVAANTSLDDRR